MLFPARESGRPTPGRNGADAGGFRADFSGQRPKPTVLSLVHRGQTPKPIVLRFVRREKVRCKLFWHLYSVDKLQNRLFCGLYNGKKSAANCFSTCTAWTTSKTDCFEVCTAGKSLLPTVSDLVHAEGPPIPARRHTAHETGHEKTNGSCRFKRQLPLVFGAGCCGPDLPRSPRMRARVGALSADHFRGICSKVAFRKLQYFSTEGM